MPVTGDVAEKVDAAKATVQLPKEIRNRLGMGDITVGGHGCATEFSHLFGCGFGSREISIHQKKIGPRLGNGESNRLPHALSSTGDESNFSSKVEERCRHFFEFFSGRDRHLHH